MRDDAPLDLDELRARREARFKQRRRVIQADPTLTPRQKQILLDRTLVPTAGQVALIGVKQQRVTLLRSGARLGGETSPHPSILPEMDEPVGYVAGVPDPGIELGRLVEWLEQRGTHMLNDDGQLDVRPGADPAAVAAVAALVVKLGEYRPGAIRTVRTTRSRKPRQPGQIPAQADGDDD